MPNRAGLIGSMFLTVALAASATTFLATARADQTATAPGATKPADIPSLNSTVPDAPAFTILGVTPSQITRPKTPTEVAAALGTAVGADGNLHTGAAIELSPGLLIHAVDISEYQHWYYRFLHNAQLSLGTASSTSAASMTGAGGASAADLALGFRLTVYDAADPLLDQQLMRAYQDVFANRPPPSFPTTGGTVTDLSTDVQTRLADARAKAAARAWNASAVQVTAAYAWTSPDSAVRTLTHKAWAAWATGAKGLGSWGQSIGTFRVIKNGSAAGQAGTQVVAGGRLVVGGPKWAASTEAAFNHLSADDSAASDSWGQATAAFELNISTSSWLEISFGDAFDKRGQNDRFFSLANVKWSVDSKRVLLPPPPPQ